MSYLHKQRKLSPRSPDKGRQGKILQIARESGKIYSESGYVYTVIIRHGHVDQRKASRWAMELLSGKEFVVLDSETTGLKHPTGFVEVAIADSAGKPLVNTTIRPKLLIESGASKVHGYTAEALADSPVFKQVYPDILDAINGRRVVVYNARYDRRVFDTEVGMLGTRGLLSGRYLPVWECAMGWYSQFVGEPGKRGGYKYQKLPGGDHSALGDCRATLKVLKDMARGA